MHRHFIASALACFGSSLLGQTIPNPAAQSQGTLSTTQNTPLNVDQSSQAQLDRNVQQSSGSAVLESGQNNSSLNTQGQLNVTPAVSGNAKGNSDSNLQNNSKLQPGQLNSNLPTQLQGQPAVGVQQQGNLGTQSTQFNGQGNQAGQTQVPVLNGSAMQNRGLMQNRARIESGNSNPVGNMQQAGKVQSAGPVYMLRFDANGREFICVNGMSVYFDKVNTAAILGNNGSQNQYRAGYGSYDQNKMQSSNETPSNSDQKNSLPRYSELDQSGSGGNTKDRIAESSNQNIPDVSPPLSERSDFKQQNEIKAPQNEAEKKSDLNLETEALKATDTSKEPKI